MNRWIIETENGQVGSIDGPHYVPDNEWERHHDNGTYRAVDVAHQRIGYTNHLTFAGALNAVMRRTDETTPTTIYIDRDGITIHTIDENPRWEGATATQEQITAAHASTDNRYPIYIDDRDGDVIPTNQSIQPHAIPVWIA